MKVNLINFTPDAERLISTCAAECYQADPNKDRVEMLIRSKHLSTLRSAFASIRFIDVSFTCARQLIRHELMEYGADKDGVFCPLEGPSQRGILERSFRYTTLDQREDYAVVPPLPYLDDPEAQRAFQAFEESYKNQMLVYNELRSLGVKKEDARFALPVGTKTSLTITGNMEMWLHWLFLREAKSAQWEVREVAKTVRKMLHEIAPMVFPLPEAAPTSSHEVALNAVYQHFKGGEYATVDFVNDAETDSKSIVYRNIDDGRLWVRPLEEFNGYKKTRNGWVKRFTFIKQC